MGKAQKYFRITHTKKRHKSHRADNLMHKNTKSSLQISLLRKKLVLRPTPLVSYVPVTLKKILTLSHMWRLTAAVTGAPILSRCWNASPG